MTWDSQTTPIGDCAHINLSRGYTEQQEWDGSLSSTLGREEGCVYACRQASAL